MLNLSHPWGGIKGLCFIFVLWGEKLLFKLFLSFLFIHAFLAYSHFLSEISLKVFMILNQILLLIKLCSRNNKLFSFCWRSWQWIWKLLLFSEIAIKENFSLVICCTLLGSSSLLFVSAKSQTGLPSLVLSPSPNPHPRCFFAIINSNGCFHPYSKESYVLNHC